MKKRLTLWVDKKLIEQAKREKINISGLLTDILQECFKATHRDNVVVYGKYRLGMVCFTCRKK